MRREWKLISASGRGNVLEIVVDPSRVENMAEAMKEVRTEIRELGAVGAANRKRVQVWGDIPTPMALMMGHELGKLGTLVELKVERGGFLPCIGF